MEWTEGELCDEFSEYILAQAGKREESFGLFSVAYLSICKIFHSARCLV